MTAESIAQVVESLPSMQEALVSVYSSPVD